jgi:signal transduction histidine kinase
MNKRLLHISASIFILLFISLVYQWKPFFIYQNINTKNVETEIKQIINIANTEADSLLHNLKKNYYKEHKTYQLVLRQNKKIIYWSDNKINFSGLDNVVKNGIYKLNNIFYYIWKKEQKNKDCFLFIPIKSDFPFENNFLQNTTLSNLSIPNNYTPVDTNINAKTKIYYQNKLLFKLKENNTAIINQYWKTFLIYGYFSCLVLILILIGIYLRKTNLLSIKQKIGVWVAFIILFKFLLLQNFSIPFFEDLYLFQPYDYASSFIPSLGDLLIDTIFLLSLFNFPIRVLYQENIKLSLSKFRILNFLSLIIFIALAFFIQNILRDSNSNFTNFDDLMIRYQDILILFILGLLLIIPIKIQIFTAHHSSPLSFKELALQSLIIYLPFIILTFFIQSIIVLIILLALLVFIILQIKINNLVNKYTIRLLILIVTTIFLVGFTAIISKEKEITNREIKLENIANEKNSIAEFLLQDIDKRIKKDSLLFHLIYQAPQSSDLIYKYLEENYFSGFWSQFNPDITICGNTNDFKENNKTHNCAFFFNKKINANTNKIANSHFVSIDNHGNDSYLGKYPFTLTKDSVYIDLYIELIHKEQYENLGYPEILLSKRVNKKENKKYYSSAQYIDKELQYSQGDYIYPSYFLFPQKDKEEYLVQKDNYSHLIRKNNKHSYTIISKEQETFWNFVIIISYVFILYILIFYLFEFTYDSRFCKHNFQLLLKDRLRISFIAILFVSFVLTAYSVISKSTALSENKQEQILKEKMQSVLIELKHKISSGLSISSEDNKYLNYLLIKFSNVFFTDINLYNLSGHLIASSRPEVFEKGLIGKQMNAQSYYELNHLSQTSFMHKESIGKLNYLSAYIPIKDKQSKIIAYLNLPYFAKEKELRADIATLISTFLNIFILLFLASGVVAIFISNRITHPLSVLQEKLKQFRIEQKNEPIIYKSKDEIGSLVEEYNKTVLELKKNIELLAQKERETAWKEMSKQIAHEIKNPLTPMKLSVQHLQKIWEDQAPNKEEKLKQTSHLLIKQIDHLAEIASAFSDFSKMTQTKPSVFDISKILEEQALLFKQECEISIQYHDKDQFYIWADEKQVSRVLQNLLSNAIQAVPDNKNAKIEINIKKKENRILIEIKDNGNGISKEIKEKMFEPNFTTKSTGMGLGLAIVKQIMTNNKGTISFKTKEGKGSVFIIDFPISK